MSESDNLGGLIGTAIGVGILMNMTKRMRNKKIKKRKTKIVRVRPLDLRI